MAKARSEAAVSSCAKQWLRLLLFAEGRKLVLKSENAELWFEELNSRGAKCRISAQALQQAISVGLFVIGEGGKLVERPEAEAFRQRHAQEPLAQDPVAYLRQHHQLEPVILIEEASVQRRIVQRSLSSLTLLERLRAADGSAYFARPLVEAGEQLAGDFNRGQLQPRVSARWEPRLELSSNGARNHAGDLSDQAMAARQRFNLALSAIGPELSGVVVDAICFEKGLELIERERQWPARSAKLMLRTGLEILSRHYHPQPRRPMRSWAEPRP